MKAFAVCAVVAGVAALGLVAGCTDLGVGRKCLPTSGDLDAGISGLSVNSPSLECRSRLCFLHEATPTGPQHSFCTAGCTSDSDCNTGLQGSTPGLCNAGFVCAIPNSLKGTEHFCQQLCVCRDDLVAGTNQDPQDGGVICPPACAVGGLCPAAK